MADLRRRLEETFGHGPCKLWIDSDIPFFQSFIEEGGLAKIWFNSHCHVRVFFDQNLVHIGQNFRFRTQLPSNDQVFFFRFGKKTWCIRYSQSDNHYRKSRKDGPQFGLFHPFEKKVKGDGQEGRRQGTDQNQTGIIAVNP